MTDDRQTVDELAADAARDLREYGRGNLPTDHRDVDPVSGLVESDDLRELLVFARQAWDRERSVDDPEIDETRFWRDRVERAASDRADRAISEGDLSTLRFLIGRPDFRPDVSGIHAFQRLETWLTQSEQTKLVYIAALMGRGKTDFSLLMLEVVSHFYRRLRESGRGLDVPTPKFATNFRVSTPSGEPDVSHIDNFDDLVEWTEGESSDSVLWFVFDEASTELTAQSGANAQDVAEVMAPFVKKMRKSGVNMIVIGHDKRDVAPAIRSLADFIDKGGTKKASVYAGIKKREPTGHLFDLSGIPPTSWDYDTDDTAEWSWGSALDDGDLDESGVDKQTLKRFTAIRAADIYQSLDEVTMSEAVDLVSDDVVEISTKMLKSARDGKYDDMISVKS